MLRWIVHVKRINDKCRPNKYLKTITALLKITTEMKTETCIRVQRKKSILKQ